MATALMHPYTHPLSQSVYRDAERWESRTSHLLPIDPAELYHLLCTRPRPVTSSHYRPISTINQQATPTPPSPSKFRRLSKPPSPRRSQHSPPADSMHFFKDCKDKEKEKENRHSKHELAPQKSISAPTFSVKSTKRLQDMLAPVISSSEDISIPRNEFYPRTWWARKHGMHRLHPYQQDTPNVFAYDSVLVDSDRKTNALLQKLTTKGNPTFHDYGKKPPSRVLDLGCGDMNWVESAAEAWAGQTQGVEIVGFDLVDVPRMLWKAGKKPKPHTSFVQGDFVNFPLPFKSGIFDLVRMSCLGLNIPIKRWTFVIAEAFRVLKSGGRLEIIDDQLTFPYGPEPKTPTKESYSEVQTLKKRPSSFFVDADEAEESPVAMHAEEDCPKQGQDSEYVDDMDIEHLIDLMLVNSQPLPQKQRRAMFLSCPRMSDILEVDEMEYQDITVLTPRPTRNGVHSPSTPTPGNPNPDMLRADTPTPTPSSAPSAQSIAPSTSVTVNLSTSCPSVQNPAISITSPVTPPRPTRPVPPLPSKLAPPLPPRAPCQASPSTTQPPHIESPNASPAITAHSSKDGLVPISPKLPRSRQASAGTGATANWHSSVEVSRSLEDIFAHMLIEEHGIHLTPHQQLETFIGEVFGASNSSKTHSIHIKLASGDPCSSSSDSDSDRASIDSGYASLKDYPKDETKRSTFGRKGKLSRTESSSSSDGESDLHDSSEGSSLSAKAADRLGITYSALGHATATSRPQTTNSGPVQSPGIVVWPDTFIPMTGTELEMHTCRHMHSLLGAKAAIADFLVKAFPHSDAVKDAGPDIDAQSIRSVATEMPTVESTQSLVSLEELEDALWDYECFRRRRFNWPDSLPETEVTPKKHARNKSDSSIKSSSSSNSTYRSSKYGELTHIRSFRVFEAVKPTCILGGPNLSK